MRVELLPVEPAGAVDARQHRVLLVAAPIGARHAGQLERLRDRACRSRRGAARGTGRASRRCGRSRSFSSSGSSIAHSALKRLALLLEEVADLRRATRPRAPAACRRDDAPHLLLDRRQVLVGERAAVRRRREVVIEAVVGRRAEGDLRAREQLLHRLGEDMGIIVPRQLERVGLVARGDQRKLGIALERPVEVAHLAVDPRRQRRLGEARPDRRRDVGRRGPALDLADRSIGQLDREHIGHVGAAPGESDARRHR